MTTIEQYRGMLLVNKHRLDEELEIQADIMDRISVQVVLSNSRSIEAKDELGGVEATIGLALKEADPKLTVAMVEAEVRMDRKRITAWQKYQAARAEHEAWTGLLDAWRERGRSMKLLGDLYGANYWTLTSISGDGPKSQAQRDLETDSLRAELRRAGHQDRVTPVAPEPTPTLRRQRVQG